MPLQTSKKAVKAMGSESAMRCWWLAAPNSFEFHAVSVEVGFRVRGARMPAAYSARRI